MVSMYLRFQKQVGSLCLIFSMLSLTKPIWGSIICWIMGSRYSGFPVCHFQHTVGDWIALFLMLSWARPTWCRVIILIMGSMHNGFPVLRFQNTVGLLHCVLFLKCFSVPSQSEVVQCSPAQLVCTGFISFVWDSERITWSQIGCPADPFAPGHGIQTHLAPVWRFQNTVGCMSGVMLDYVLGQSNLR